jgi:predicted Zn-dependent protease
MYGELVRADPADRDAWEPLVGVYRRMGDSAKLVELLGTVVEYVDNPAERARLRLERVRTMVQALAIGDAEAVSLLREIVDDDASQAEAALMLAAILERTGQLQELAGLLERQLESAKDRQDSGSVASFALRLGRLLEKTDRMQARNVYYAGLDWEPENRELLDALILLLDSEDDTPERADLMERRIAVERGPAAEAMATSLAAIRTDSGDEAAAERALELGYRAHPASAPLRDRLEAAYRARDDWAKLAELCVLDASSRPDLSERVAKLREAAAIRRSELRDPGAAAAALRLAREAAPDDHGLLRDLVDMLMEAKDFAAAVSELDTAIDAVAGDAPPRAPLLAARAAVRRSAGDEAGALADLEAAFSLDRETHALAFAGELEHARRTATAAADAATARTLRLREAQVRPYAGEVDGARSLLAELLKEDPKDRAALRTLASLETALERWDAASAALRRLVGVEEGEAAIEASLRLADVCENAGRPADARGALERARVVAPERDDVRARLVRVYELTGAWHELAELALEDARASRDVAQRFERLVRAGTILLEAGDPGAAIPALEEARALRPADLESVGPLADAYTQSGRPQEALAVLEQIIAPFKGKRARELAPLHLRVARVARYNGDTDEELRSLALALECDTQNGSVCADVAVRAIELDQLELANRALRAVTLLKAPGPMSKALAYQYMGEIARRQGDGKRALLLLKRALTEDQTLEGARALIDAIERGM